ncbi:MAG: hypothetical protein LH632_18585 [Rhodoferax sp.]|nr:hypothetical protein [Rhodoferax sp.]
MTLHLHIELLDTTCTTPIRDLEFSVEPGQKPFSKLDRDLRARLREFVFALTRKRQIPIRTVTHDEADIADPAHVTNLGQRPGETNLV